MAEAAEQRWTVEAFLDWDDGTDRRHELVDGRIVATARYFAPASRHGGIVDERLSTRSQLPAG